MPSAVPRTLLLLALTWVGVYWLLPGPWRPARTPQHLPDYSGEREPPPMIDAAPTLTPLPGSHAPGPGPASDSPAAAVPDPSRDPSLAHEPAAGPGSAPSSGDHGEQFHEVEPGDSLWKIALRYYGSGDRAADIFNANRDVLKSPASLKLGTRLRIPAR